MFLKLNVTTKAGPFDPRIPVVVNTDHIVCFQDNTNGGSYLILRGAIEFNVVETPEQILALMQGVK